MEPTTGGSGSAANGGSGSPTTGELAALGSSSLLEDDIDTLFAHLSQELTVQEEVSIVSYSKGRIIVAVTVAIHCNYYSKFTVK